LVEVTLHRTRRDIRQGGYLRVSEPLVFQPQHFHLLLHARMRMMKTLVANLLDDLLAELEGTHGCRFPFASFAPAMLYGIKPASATLPNSAAGSIRSTAFAARLPDLQPGPLMDVDFAVSCPLVRPGLPPSGFCTSGRGFATRFLQTPPHDDALAFLLILHLHQVG